MKQQEKSQTHTHHITLSMTKRNEMPIINTIPLDFVQIDDDRRYKKHHISLFYFFNDDI